jgi:translation initiation factor IF-2
MVRIIDPGRLYGRAPKGLEPLGEAGRGGPAARVRAGERPASEGPRPSDAKFRTASQAVPPCPASARDHGMLRSHASGPRPAATARVSSGPPARQGGEGGAAHGARRGGAGGGAAGAAAGDAGPAGVAGGPRRRRPVRFPGEPYIYIYIYI